MMKKKLFAFVVSLMCFTSTFSGFSVTAEDTTEALPVYEMVVVGVDNEENPGRYVLMDTETSNNLAGTYYFEANYVKECMPDVTLSNGDILRIEGYLFWTTKVGTNSMGYNAIPSMTVVGSVLTEGMKAPYTVKGVCVDPAFDYWTITDVDGIEHRSYCDFLKNGNYTQPGYIDWFTCKTGDEVTMYTYKDVPCLPVEINPLGDVNADSTLNVLDVVTMNKHLLTGAELPALASASGEAKLAKSGETDLGQCDFNGNGVIDPDDSLCMLKRIVGLETIESE